jgi:hypothetical protein
MIDAQRHRNKKLKGSSEMADHDHRRLATNQAGRSLMRRLRRRCPMTSTKTVSVNAEELRTTFEFVSFGAPLG